MKSFKKQYINTEKQFNFKQRNKSINYVEHNKKKCFLTEISFLNDSNDI